MDKQIEKYVKGIEWIRSEFLVMGIADWDDSAQAFATVIGPLIEVPIIVGLVHIARRARVLFD